MFRSDERAPDQLRPVYITTDYLMHAPGSVLIEFGRTKVICTATVDEKAPPFLKGTGKGWITGEYGMLPASTQKRKVRDASRGKIDGRTQEIQRLIGRALRSIVDLEALGERTVWIDCDVIQADGGTRTASITGSFVALVYCIKHLMDQGLLKVSPIKNFVAAVSVGIYENVPILDLCYEEDSAAKVDMNLVMTDDGQFIEIQGTGEESPFSPLELYALIELGQAGIHSLIQVQKEALGPLMDFVGAPVCEV